MASNPVTISTKPEPVPASSETGGCGCGGCGCGAAESGAQNG